MTVLNQQIMELINRPGKIGVLATADLKGCPNLAYFGSAKLSAEGDFLLALGDNRTLSNLEQNPNAAYLVLGDSPVTFRTPGWRLYLKVRAVDREGEILATMRKDIADKVGPKAAESITAAILFDIMEIRQLVDQS